MEQIADRVAFYLSGTALVYAADSLSTGLCLAYTPGCIEKNPVTPNGQALYGLSTAKAVIMGYTTYRLERSGHKNGARWVFIANIATSLVFVIIPNTKYALQGH